MTVSHKELEKWFKARPKWLQEAAYRLVQNGTLTEHDYENLLTLCIQEASGQTVRFSGIPTGALDVTDSPMQLRLRSISGVQGINALSQSKPLDFGEEPLCIVYGRNAAGKSGYVRLLKHICGSRKPGILLGNVFETTAQTQTPKITIAENGQEETLQWSGMPIPELQGVEIYDTASGLVYVNEECEVAFEPWLLRFFTQLTNTCITLSQRIQEKKRSLVSKKPIFPAEYSSTRAVSWYGNLTVSTTDKELDEKTMWDSRLERELSSINKRLVETAPEVMASILRRKKALILQLVAELKKYFNELSDNRCRAFIQMKLDAALKRKAAEEDANKLFEEAPLTGVGSETWQFLWEAARRYSEEYVYKDLPFPYIEQDAHCVLCQRELDAESRQRFTSFENYVKGELQRHADEAEQRLQKAIDTFVIAPDTEALMVKMDAAGIMEEATRSMVIDIAAQFARRRQSCLDAREIVEVSALPTNEVLIQLISIARDFLKQAIAYDEDAKGQKIQRLEQMAMDLAAQKWLHQQRKSIEEEIARLKDVNILDEAERLTNTKALSTRKSILADELITNAYKERFAKELNDMGLKISVEVDKSRAEVGRVYHRISLCKVSEDVKAIDVLSEGEFRIVSIAAFLSDTEGRNAKTPFIFDDPISSLDHVYEKAIAKRLVKLSQSRQVIVFTHRISFAAYLEKYSEKRGISPTLRCLSHYVPGEIAAVPMYLKKTRPAVNYLLKERLAAARKAYSEDDTAYEKEVKGLCSDIRIVIERIVEKDMLNDIVRRFNPEVQTKNKIYALAKITEDDCRFIDDYMTKYSSFEHSQPEEAPQSLPDPDEIQSDLESIAEFVKRMQERK